METGPSLALYHYVGCFFCARVRSAAESLGFEIELRDIQVESEHAQDLMEATGRTTVPVLRITESDGEILWLSESRDIIEYLEGSSH